MEIHNIERIDDLVRMKDVSLIPHIVKKSEEMRLDKIISEYYGTNKYILEVTYINGITNLYSIKEGQVLLLPTPDYITDVFDFSQQIIEDVKDYVSEMNNKRKKRTDNNRKKDIQNRKKTERDKRVPPQIISGSKVEINNGKMVLKSNF